MFKRIFISMAAALVVTGAAAQDLGRQLFNDGWTFNFDKQGETSVRLPHDWAIKGDFSQDNPSGTGGGALPGGIGWYRKSFVVDKSDRDKRFRIDFDGVYMNATVWINNHELGKRPYGYISFGYDITPYLKYGKENMIVVKVDNSEQPNSRWYSGCGIYRNVWLTKHNKVHVINNGVQLVPQVNGINDVGADGTQTASSGTVLVKTTLANNGEVPATVYVQQALRRPEGNVLAKSGFRFVRIPAGDTITIDQTVTCGDVHLWNVSDPYLYVVETEVRPKVMSKSHYLPEHDGVGFVDDVLEQAAAQPNGLVTYYQKSYQCPATYDVCVNTVGFRQAEFTDKGFSLNGRNMQIQGVCLHHDLGCLGAAINCRAIQRQLEILKNMGINGIRCSHNPPSPELLNLCDQMGFLVMDEAFDMWRKKKTAHDYARYFNKWHEQDLHDFVVRDRNHPSVVMWSIGNEVLEQWTQADADTLSLAEANLILNFGHSKDMLAKEDGKMSVNSLLTKKLADFVRDLDTDRPITAGCNEPDKNNHLFKSGALDIIGYNYHNQNIPDVPKNFPGKPFIITESNSALMTRGYYRMPSDSMFVWPERWDKPFFDPSFSCSSYENCHVPWGNTNEETLLLMKNNPWICGQFVWTGFDYIGEPTPYGWPARSSYFGIVDLAGFPKDVYYLYQSELTKKDVLHLFPHWTWNTPEAKSQLIDGKKIDMWAYYNNADEVELFVNGESQGVRRKTDDQLHVTWRVNYVPGEVKVVSRKDGKEVKTESIMTASVPAKIRLTPDRKMLTADGRDLSFVTVEVIDEYGNLCPWADNLINFSVKGNAFVAGVDNGSPTSLERFADTKRHAFYGKCLVVLQNDGKAGVATLTATSDGLASGVVSLSATEK